MANGIVTMGEIAEHLATLTVECSRCGRRGRYRTARLVEKYGEGATVAPFQDDLTRDCPTRHDPKIALGHGCAPLFPDLKLLPRNQPREPK